MKKLDYSYTDAEELKTFMQRNELDGPLLAQLFSCDKFEARRISHELHSINNDTKISVLNSKSFECTQIHFTVLPRETNIVAQVQPMEFDFFHARPVTLLKHIVVNGVMELTDVSPSISQWGYEPEWFFEDPEAVKSIVHADDINRVLDVFSKSIQKGENAINLKYRIIKKDGTTAWISNYTQIIRDANDALIQVLCYWLDISQDKENEVLYTEIINTTTEGFWLLDENLKIIDVNYALCAMLGFTKEEMIGKNPQDFVHLRDHTLCQAQAKLICDISSRTYEINLMHKKGETLCVLASGTTIYDQLGSMKSFIFFTDISKQKKIEEDLREQKASIRKLNDILETKIALEVQKNREKDQMMYQQSRFASMGEMIGNIAHQWRQPLNIMALIMQDIYISDQLGKLSSQKVEDSYEKANDTLQYMSQTIDDFRYFFKQDSKEQAFSIKEAINSVYSLLGTTLSYNHIRCTVDIQHDSTISGGLNEFKQVFINILNNAQEAILSSHINQKEIKIVATQKGSNAIIVISDAGGGIAKDVISKIFDPYFTTKEKTQGTGLGLFMSKQIIENLMLGSLGVENISEGAEFTITLPIKE